MIKETTPNSYCDYTSYLHTYPLHILTFSHITADQDDVEMMPPLPPNDGNDHEVPPPPLPVEDPQDHQQPPEPQLEDGEVNGPYSHHESDRSETNSAMDHRSNNANEIDVTKNTE